MYVDSAEEIISRQKREHESRFFYLVRYIYIYMKNISWLSHLPGTSSTCPVPFDVCTAGRIMYPVQAPVVPFLLMFVLREEPKCTAGVQQWIYVHIIAHEPFFFILFFCHEK